MPELPEVETMRRGIAAVAGCQIADIQRPRCKLRPILVTPSLTTFRRRAMGATIDSVDRAGKRVVLVLDTSDRIVIEPRMTGLVLLAEPPDRAHLRLRIQLTASTDDVVSAVGGTRLATAPVATNPPGELLFWDRRGLGIVRLCSAGEFEERYGPGKLGPDALCMPAADLKLRLCRRHRPIKVALLDQHAVAGIGNLYASEILHLARVHPATSCDQISSGQWRRIHQATLAVLEEAIRHEGSTLSDGTYRNAQNQNGSYQNHHRVYDRAGELCMRCRRAAIVRVVQAQRSTFYCPRCQPERHHQSRG
jgi:formamidopyrimidine-DNA glycosylase